MRALAWAAGLLGGAALLAGGGIVATTYALDSGALTPRILAEIEAATGRAATLGRVSVGLGLTPRVVIEDATLANAPGGSRPDMARIRRAEASIALWPLLRGDIAFRAIAIEGADILLERAADGTPNWVFRPSPRDAAPGPATPAPEAAERPRRRLLVGSLTLADSRVTLPDPRLGTITVETARIRGLGEGAAETFAARITLHGTTFDLEGAAPPAPAPLRAELAAGSHRISVLGRPGQPASIEASLPDLTALRPLLGALAPGLELPATVPPLTGSLRLGADLRPQSASLQAGAADLSGWLPGLALARLEASLPATDQPARMTITGSRNGMPITVAVTLENPFALLPGSPEAPVGLALRAEAAGASAQATGTLQRPQALEGLALDLRLTVPDMLALAPLLPDPVPLREVGIAARIVAADPLRGPLRVEALRIEAPALAATGELRLTPGRPFGIAGRLEAARIDMDALARRVPGAAPATAPATATPGPAPPPAAGPAPPAPAAARQVIPDIALPLAGLATWHGRLDLRAAQARIQGAEWRDLHAVLEQEDHVLRVAPLSVVSPGGALRGELRIDRRANPPLVALALHSEGQGLDLAALRMARREAPGIEGHAQVAIDLAGHGATTRAIAATLTGRAGLALVDGRFDRAGLLRLGPELMAMLVPGAPPDGLALRCLALAATAEQGMVLTDALLAETSVGRVGGAAAINLGTEAIAARLLPDVRLFGVAVRAPVGVGGMLAAPRVGVSPGLALERVMGDSAANRLWREPATEWLRGRGSAPPGGDCADQLRVARMDAEGPEPPAPLAPEAPRDLRGPAQDLLRGLLGGGRAR